MACPVVASGDGVNLRPELMERERLYHCFFRDKLMLFFKDSQDFLNCYEVEERDLVERARGAPGAEVERIVEEYAGRLREGGGDGPGGGAGGNAAAEGARPAGDG